MGEHNASAIVATSWTLGFPTELAPVFWQPRPPQTRTLNGRNSMLLRERNPNSGAALSSGLFNSGNDNLFQELRGQSPTLRAKFNDNECVLTKLDIDGLSFFEGEG